MPGNRLQCLTANDWVLIQANASRHTFRPGEEIIKEGERPGCVYIIRRGEAIVELAGNGSRVIVASLGPDDICGEMAFLERGKATASVVVSREEVEADEIASSELRELFAVFPGLASRFYLSLAVMLARRLRATSRELAREISLQDLRVLRAK